LLQFGALRLDLDKHTLTRNGESVKVSKLEFSALRALMEGVGKVLTRGELVQAMYGQESNLDSNAVEVHIHNLRAKIGASTLLTVRGIGYSFVARRER
jgi:DNA-binding response OmpR family regulator